MSHLFGRSVLNLLASFVSMASGFVVAVIIARVLGPEGLGATAFAIWLTTALAAIVDRGWPQTALRFGAMSDPAERRATIVGIRRQWALGLLFSVVVFAGAAVVSMLFATPNALSEPLILLAICVVYSTAGFAASSRRAYGDFLSPARSSIIGSLLYVPGSILGASLAGASGAVAALLLRSIPMLPLLRIPPHSDGEEQERQLNPSREAKSYALQIWISDLLDILVLSRVEYLFLSLIATSADLGLFAVAIAFAGLVEQLSLQISAPLVVSFASRVSGQLPNEHYNDHAHAQQLIYERAVLGLSVVCLPICFGGAAIMSLLLPLVYSAAYVDLVPMASILLVSSALSALSVLPWSALSASGHANVITRSVLVLAVTTIVVLPVAIFIWGLWGAVIAKSLLQIAGFFLFQIQLERLGGARLPIAHLARVLISATVSALSAMAILHVFQASVVLVLAVAICVAATVYVIFLRMTCAIPRSHFSALASAPDVNAPALTGPRRVMARLVSLILS
ncbi:oligosaccharide flippase family protein [Pannonibacter carbonis]|uniref:oligosaccharide flippase family protein n=1 Tax=Pannonibacter carbonis TaxID=2067569 RepID=UPI000D1139BE|nr:oligosaccharide flippase family protein [Pannonibacter carbonis]